jgi:DNA-binding beta-propeller fold protein YncE
MAVTGLWLVFFLVVCPPRAVWAEEAGEETVAPVPVPAAELMRLVTILDQDDQGRPLRFPVNIATDNDQEEIYVINGGQGNIQIYGRDFFPHLVLGAGRGIDSPQCVFFDTEHGRVYIGQNRTTQKPSRLTILNAAFLPEQEVTFSAMPEAAGFSITNGMVGKNGKLYLIGNQSRGVLVLDPHGNFSHWLKPVDKLFVEPVKTTDSSQERQAYLTEMQKGSEEPPPAPEASAAPLGLPTELLPKALGTLPTDKNKGQDLHPVLLHDIAIDSDGRIFLLSEETSKVYVYGPGENFLFSFGQKGGSTGKMSRPRGLCLDEKKKCIYIVDYMRHTVLTFNMAGRYIFEFGGRGTGPLWFNFPTAIDVDRRGRLVIADLFNNRVQVLESDFAIEYPVFGNIKGRPPREQPAAGEQPAE